MDQNVLQSKGAIHYLRDNELNENKIILKSQINKEKSSYIYCWRTK